MIEAKEGRNPLGPIIREPQYPPGRGWDTLHAGQNPQEQTASIDDANGPEEDLSKLITDKTPKPIKLAINLVAGMPYSHEERQSILAYYLWVEGNGKFDMAEQHMKISKTRTSTLLGGLMESDELSKAYTELEEVLSLSHQIFTSYKGPKTDERLVKISEIITQRLRQGDSKETITGAFGEISELSGGTREINKLPRIDQAKMKEAGLAMAAKNKEKRQARIEEFKKFLDNHLSEFGQTPIDLRALASTNGLPTYSVLVNYYYVIKKDHPVPPIVMGRRRKNSRYPL